MPCRRFDHDCRRFGLSPCCLVAVLVVAVLDLSPFWLSPFRLVAVLTCIRHHDRTRLYSVIGCACASRHAYSRSPNKNRPNNYDAKAYYMNEVIPHKRQYAPCLHTSTYPGTTRISNNNTYNKYTKYRRDVNDTFRDIIFTKCVNLLFCQFRTWWETNTKFKTTTEEITTW